MKKRFESWLADAFGKNASDIHLTIGKAPVFRVNGMLIEQEGTALSSTDARQIARVVFTEKKLEDLGSKRELDCTYSIHGLSRFRVHAFFQRGELSFAIRIIPSSIPTMEQLHLPETLKQLCDYPQGLVLVTGPTGSGKSTTLASLVNHINQTKYQHIITLEDPIEYLHTHQKSIIDQREVGSDTENFAAGLRASLRQDPDIILVGEMRDLETISTAITAAETGHLVLGTLHTSGAVATIERIIDVFPPQQQDQVRLQLSSLLKAIVSQRLLISKSGHSRRPVTELLLNTSAVKNLIRNDKLHQIQNVLQTSTDKGMHTMQMNVEQLLQMDEIEWEAAAPYLQEGVMLS